MRPKTSRDSKPCTSNKQDVVDKFRNSIARVVKVTPKIATSFPN